MKGSCKDKKGKKGLEIAIMMGMEKPKNQYGKATKKVTEKSTKKKMDK